VVAVAAVLLSRTIKGFEIRVVGAAPRAARFGGFNSDQLILLTFAISGGLAGLAGIIEVAGPVGHLQPGISPGYGFTAIIVAFLGRLNPLAVIPAGLLLALTYLGGDAAQLNLGMSNAITGIFQGILLFCLLGSDVLILHRLRWSSRRVAPGSLVQGAAELSGPEQILGNRIAERTASTATTTNRNSAARLAALDQPFGSHFKQLIGPPFL